MLALHQFQNRANRNIFKIVKTNHYKLFVRLSTRQFLFLD